MIIGTALLRPPIAFVATCTLWRSLAEMRDYALGRPDPRHIDAIKANRKTPFHHQDAFVRFRPYASAGTWGGSDPLAEPGLAGGRLRGESLRDARDAQPHDLPMAV